MHEVKITLSNFNLSLKKLIYLNVISIVIIFLTNLVVLRNACITDIGKLKARPSNMQEEKKKVIIY